MEVIDLSNLDRFQKRGLRRLLNELTNRSRTDSDIISQLRSLSTQPFEKESQLYLYKSKYELDKNMSIPIGGFESLDDEDQQIVCRGGLPFILIEDASEIFRETVQTGTNLEKMLDFVFSEFPDVGFVPSITFNFATHKTNISNVKWLIEQMITSGEYQYIVGIHSLDLESNGAEGGHYAMFLADLNYQIVYYFDSMQTSQTQSVFSDKFQSVALRLFPRFKPKLINCQLEKWYSFQATGGFLVEQEYDETDEEFEIRQMSTERQNHFCYIWSIFFLHHIVSNIKTQTPYDTISQLMKKFYKENYNPIFIIKRYAYLLFLCVGLEQQLSEYNSLFFITHFPNVWMYFPRKHLYGICRISFPSISKIKQMSPKEILNFSTQIVSYICHEHLPSDSNIYTQKFCQHYK